MNSQNSISVNDFGISHNVNITMNDIEYYYPDYEWRRCDRILSHYENVDKLIKLYPDYEWWEFITKPRIDIFEKYIDKWDYSKISVNVDLEIIDKYPNLPWLWRDVSFNTNLTFKFVEKYIDKDWYWFHLSRVIDVDENVIEKYFDNGRSGFCDQCVG